MLQKVKRLFKRDSDDDCDRESGTEQLFQNLENFYKVAGQVVNPNTAQRVATVYACTQAIAESLAMLPVNVFEEVDERTTKGRNDHPLAKLLKRGPNPFMDSFEFFETMQLDLLSYGNCCAHILRDNGGRVLELKPLPAELVQIKQDPAGNRTYTFNGKTYPAKEIFHIRYRSRDGLWGRSPITVASATFGFGQALQEFHTKLMENGAFMSGLLESPTTFETDEARDRFMDSFKKFMGAHNAGKYGLLEAGVKYVPHQQTNQEAQLIELSRFSVIEIAKIYRMPPHMIQELEKGMSYASVEQMAIMFIQYTIQPWVTRWERAIAFQLLNEEESLSVKFNISALIRGDLKSRTEALITQIKYGLKTINEARNSLDENPVNDEIGDEVLIDVNLKTATQLMHPAELEAPAAEEPDPEEDPEEEPEEPPADLEAEPEAAAAPAPEAIREAFLPLLKSNLDRLIAVEQKALKRLLKKENFLKEAEEFYRDHNARLTETLEPILNGLQKLSGRGAEIEINRSALLLSLQHSDQLLAAAKEKPSEKALASSIESFSNSAERWAEDLYFTYGCLNED